MAEYPLRDVVIMYSAPCDYVPNRSYPLFRTRAIWGWERNLKGELLRTGGPTWRFPVEGVHR